MSFLKKNFHRLPGPVKRVYAAIREARCAVAVLEGAERAGGEPLRVGYAGGEALKSYLTRRLFAYGHRQTALGTFARDRALSVASAADKELALFLWEIPQSQEKRFRPDAFAVLPGFVRMELSLHEGFEQGDAGRKIRRARNMVAREVLTRETTGEAAAFEEFYRELYLPYITGRHESGALLAPLAYARKEFVSGKRELIWILKDGRRVGGGALSIHGERACFHQLGVLPGLDAELAELMGDAIYYHVITRAQKRGARLLDLGHSRPFLKDGILSYKRDLGAHLVAARQPEAGLLALQILKQTPALKSFLKNGAFVALEEGGRYGVRVFSDAAATEAEAADWRQRHCAAGGLDLRVYSLEPSLQLARTLPG